MLFNLKRSGKYKTPWTGLNHKLIWTNHDKPHHREASSSLWPVLWPPGNSTGNKLHQSPHWGASWRKLWLRSMVDMKWLQHGLAEVGIVHIVHVLWLYLQNPWWAREVSAVSFYHSLLQAKECRHLQHNFAETAASNTIGHWNKWQGRRHDPQLFRYSFFSNNT